jgi:hypothetical protein
VKAGDYVHDRCRGNDFIAEANEMKKLSSLFQNKTVWTLCAALLAIVAVPAIVGLVLKVLGSVHGASLHSWLFDVGQNMGSDGALGAAGAAAAAASGPWWSDGWDYDPSKMIPPRTFTPDEWNRRHPDNPMSTSFRTDTWLDPTDLPDRTTASGSPATVNGVNTADSASPYMSSDT